MPENEEFEGKVARRRFGAGSKSDHVAVILETASGNLVLRRPGGNPFHDPELDALVGKHIRCRGERTDYLLILSEWTPVGGGATDPLPTSAKAQQ